MNSGLKKVVVDTNVLLSVATNPNCPTAQSLTTAFAFCTIYHSKETLHEITTVLNRLKFDRHFLDMEFTRNMFLGAYINKSIEAEITQISTDCDDPKDNMFLSLAMSTNADMIVSGDIKHLISMHPYKGIEILSSNDFSELMPRASFAGQFLLAKLHRCAVHPLFDRLIQYAKEGF